MFNVLYIMFNSLTDICIFFFAVVFFFMWLIHSTFNAELQIMLLNATISLKARGTFKVC